MNKLANIRMVVLAGMLFMLPVMLTTSCKSKKEATEGETVATVSEVDQAKDRLMGLIENKEGLSVEERRAALDKIKREGYTDPEVLKLIGKLEEQLSREEALERQKAEKAEQQAALAEMETKLNTLFVDITEAPNNLAAQAKINQALDYFESNETPVLRIIYESGSVTDYDEPTTIEKYLYYLKDMGNNPNTIKNIKYNSQGKITELELKKK